MRFSEAIKIYVRHKSLEQKEGTVKGYEKDLKNFCLYCHNPVITQIYIEQVIEYITGMKELEWKQNSIMLRCVCFRRFFKFWASKGYPVVNPELIPHVPKEYVEPRVANPDDVKKLFEVSDPNDPYDIRNVAIIKLLKDSGMRAGELCRMNTDIDTENFEKINGVKQYTYIIKTEKSKGRQPFRRVFWFEDANKEIKKWIKARKTIRGIKDPEALFVGVKTWRKGCRMDSYNVSLSMRRLSERAKLGYSLNPHSLRHLFGNEIASSGANNSIISSLMGHGSLESSYVYTHLNDKQLKHAHVKHKKKT